MPAYDKFVKIFSHHSLSFNHFPPHHTVRMFILARYVVLRPIPLARFRVTMFIFVQVSRDSFFSNSSIDSRNQLDDQWSSRSSDSSLEIEANWQSIYGGKFFLIKETPVRKKKKKEKEKKELRISGFDSLGSICGSEMFFCLRFRFFIFAFSLLFLVRKF